MRAIIIFAKAPRPGRVKTRLAAELGNHRATALYKAMALETVAVAQAVSESKVWIAYDGKNPSWLMASPDVAWFQQARGDLGNRLIHAFDRMGREEAGPVLIIGSDLPTLTPKLLKQAFRALQKVPVVIGPSRDGGYYLIGLRSPQAQLFRNIPWSTARVFRQTLAAVRKSKLRVHLLPMQRDLDLFEDLKALIAC